jgi:hypothetical protein
MLHYRYSNTVLIRRSISTDMQVDEHCITHRDPYETCGFLLRFYYVAVEKSPVNHSTLLYSCQVHFINQCRSHHAHIALGIYTDY